MEKLIACGSDHAGFELKRLLQRQLSDLNLPWEDVGSYEDDIRVDYPKYAEAVAERVLENSGGRGLLVCGSGMGMMIAANRFKGIRAALCHDVTSARLARSHNDANILVLGERLIGVSVAHDILKIFMTTEFEGGRHQKRVDQIDALPFNA